MQNTSPLKILFVVNPVSGGKEKHDWEASIREYFKDQPHAIAFYLLTGQSDVVSVRHHMDSFQPDRVVAVGGDGTVRMLADMLKETPIPLGIIPAGSANGMARELNIPLNEEEAIGVLTAGKIKKIDIIRINEEEICIHLSDVGLNAMLIKYFEKSERRGMWGYAREITRVFWNKRKMSVTIKTDDMNCKRKAYMVVLANARKYGTGANINPDGDISDGQFEVVVVRKLNVLEIIKAIFTDRSFHPRRIEVFHTKNLEMHIHRQAYFQVDGEFLGKTSSIKARILPSVLHVMVPGEPLTN